MAPTPSIAATAADDQIGSDITRLVSDLRSCAMSLQLRSILVASPPLGGVYVFPVLRLDDEWRGLIFIHKGMYRGSIFKFSVKFPPDYPASHPAIVFRSHIYHPLIAPSGEFCFAQMPKSSVVSILDMLHYVKSSFSLSFLEEINPESPVGNPEALVAFRESRAFYESKAALSALDSTSIAKLYDNDRDDPFEMIATKDDVQFNEARDRLLSGMMSTLGDS